MEGGAGAFLTQVILKGPGGVTRSGSLGDRATQQNPFYLLGSNTRLGHQMIEG